MKWTVLITEAGPGLTESPWEAGVGNHPEHPHPACCQCRHIEERQSQLEAASLGTFWEEEIRVPGLCSYSDFWRWRCGWGQGRDSITQDKTDSTEPDSQWDIHTHTHAAPWSPILQPGKGAKCACRNRKALWGVQEGHKEGKQVVNMVTFFVTALLCAGVEALVLVSLLHKNSVQNKIVLRGGLNALPRFRCLNTQSPVGGTV